MEIPPCIIEVIKRTPILSKVQERELIKKAQDGDIGARTDLIHANLRWIWRMAERGIRNDRVPWDDLFQVGIIGLMIAIKQFDPSHDVRLTTYATWWIRQEMQFENEKRSTVIKLPNAQSMSLRQERDRETAKKILDGILSLDYDLHLDNINDEYGGSVNRYKALLDNQLLDAPEAVEDVFDKREKRDIIHGCIQQLIYRERMTVKLRMRGWSLAKISRLLGVSHETSRMDEMRGHHHLKRLLLRHGIDR